MSLMISCLKRIMVLASFREIGTLVISPFMINFMTVARVLN